jgi:PAS domain-containing protein
MCTHLRTHRTLMEPEKQSRAGPPSAVEAGLPFTVVGVGASAGGYADLMTLLQNMPPSPGIALVVIRHLAADEPTGLMPSRDRERGGRCGIEMLYRHSPSWRAYTGQTPAAWLGEGWLDAVHPEDREQARHQWRQAVARRGVVDAVFRLSQPEGGWRRTRVRAEPLFNLDGSVRKWVGMNIEAGSGVAGGASAPAVAKSQQPDRS